MCHCYCWRFLVRVFITVAGLSAIAGVPGVVGVLTVADVTAVAVVIAVAGVLAVAGVRTGAGVPAVFVGFLAVASGPADNGVPILFGVCTYCTVLYNCRSMAIGLLFFCYRTIGYQLYFLFFISIH